MHAFFPSILQGLAWVLARGLFIAFPYFKVDGLENLEKVRGRTIFAANHASELDPILIRVALPFFSRLAPIFFVSLSKDYYKDKSFGWRSSLYGGLFFKSMGAWPLYRGTQDYRQSFKHHLQFLGAGRTICIFPEGKITRDGVLGRAHSGVALLAHHTLTPVVPIAISGTYHFSFKRFFLGRAPISIHFCRPILPEDLHIGPNPDQEEFRAAAGRILERVAGHQV